MPAETQSRTTSLGTDSTGKMSEGDSDGVLILGPSGNNTVKGNLISGNGDAIDLNYVIQNTTPTSGNLFIGNLIGTDVTGTMALGNVTQGIVVKNATNTTIGGTTAADRNVIANSGYGMNLFGNSDGILIQGNYFGTDATGEVAMANSEDIYDSGISDCTIGGTAAGAGNVISGSQDMGLDAVSRGTNMLIQGNMVGTDPTGTRPLGNATDGLYILGPLGVTIGGSVAAARNVISANGNDGIFAEDVTMVIQGNNIGTDITGSVPMGNGGSGINAQTRDVAIGGIAPGAGNIIANNGFTSATDRDGVTIFLVDPVLSNSIYNNHALGIDFTDGGTPQHPARVDLGLLLRQHHHDRRHPRHHQRPAYIYLAVLLDAEPE